MAVFHGRNIIVAVSGGIAAFKAVEVVSLLRKAGARVTVLMTEAATRFVTPLTFEAMSGNPVRVDLWSAAREFPVEHVTIARQADLVLVVPATANILAKLANGLADDYVSVAILATQAPVLLVPAMEEQMWLNPVTQRNVTRLKEVGHRFLDPVSGLLASGHTGMGRMAEPPEVVAAARQLLEGRLRGAPQDLADRRILVSAGPTQEPIDPVRFLSNPSTGKMGYAVAQAAQERGARVTLVSGPTHLPSPIGVETVRVRTAAEMREAVVARFEESDTCIMVAAVADFKPVQVAESKIKKNRANRTLELEPTPDILAELGRNKGGRLLVGFAAETDSPEEHAREKIRQKNLDLIVLNDIRQPGAGFAADTNLVKLIFADGRVEELPLLPKLEVAHGILAGLARLWE